ncbi:hypothetical protein PYW08_013628 [Mythimna loreyi]|uniref:Uncharacterized protein n=1 Tax=Mythimna loreyi TaxID=667449 RepID=A0ACC2QIU3_9NEOP|nr:hypothetical protein PYW08_013628 [Mythimna loreyi]
MIIIHQTLVLLTLLVGLAHSFDWDVAVGVRNKLEFYNNGAVTHSEDFGESFNIQHLVYDSTQNRLLVVNANSTQKTIIYNSCKGYIYWSNAEDSELHTIKKARIDGSETETILDGNQHVIYNMVIDQQTRKIYWTDNVVKGEDQTFSINSADLNGENRRTLLNDPERNQPFELTISKDYIYWVPFNDRTHNIWQITKNPTEDKKPTASSVSGWYTAAAKYKFEDQIQGIQDCESLRNLLPKL